MRIGIVGSACDPPHKRHIEMGERARKALRLDKILFIPTNIPPHKARPSAGAKDRLSMARLAAQDLPRWEISDMELRRRGKTYTKDTIRQLKKIYPNDELYWIVGYDAITSMPWAWKGGYDILDECQFVVAHRPGYSLHRVKKSVLKKILVLERTFKRDVSSTMIRSVIQLKKNPARFLDSRVLTYIKKKKLYETSA